MTRSKLIVTTSWDDTTRMDLKLCELMENYGIKATFYVVSNWIGKKISEDELRHISEAHEVGAHTLSHVMLTRVGNEVAREEILGSKTSLERILEKSVTSFAYPYGFYHREHVEIVKDAGFLCARTVKPYFTEIGNPFETNITMHAAPHRIRDFNLVKKTMKDIDVVFHEAALASVTLSVENPILTNDINVTGTLNLLKASSDLHVKRFIYASSAAVYGDTSSPQKREDMTPNPTWF